MPGKKGKRSPTAHRTPAQILNHGRTYQATAEQKANRAKRNAARAKMKKKVGAKAIAGKDVAHKRSLMKGGGNSPKNLGVQSKKKNRGHGRSPGGRGR